MSDHPLQGLPGGVPLAAPQQRVPPMKEEYPYLRIQAVTNPQGQVVLIMECESPRKVMLIPMPREYAAKLSRELASMAIEPSNGAVEPAKD